jgi:hypothetical protein
VKRAFAKDSTEGADNTPSDAEVVMDAMGAPEVVKDKVTSWLTAFCDVSNKVNEIAGKVNNAVKTAQNAVEMGTDIIAGNTDVLTDCVSKAFSKYVEGNSESLWLYLVDEATGEVVQPPEGSNYPIEITTPGKTLPVLLPLAKIGLKAMCITNNVAKIGRAFGYPLPSLGEEYVNMAKSAIGDLSKESSVAEFDVLQNHLSNVTQKEEGRTQEQGNTNTGKQDPETIRGAALREFERWLKLKDEENKFCDLQRVLTSEGKSCWTTGENAKKMQEGKDVLNGPEVESGDPEAIKKIRQENEDIKKANDEINKVNEEMLKANDEINKEKEELKRQLAHLRNGENPAEGTSTSPVTSHLDANWAGDIGAINGKCMYTHVCMYLHVYESVYACGYVSAHLISHRNRCHT